MKRPKIYKRELIEKKEEPYLEKKEPIYTSNDFNKQIFTNPNKYKIWNLPTQKQWEKVPPLYSQDGKGDKAKVYMKLYTPSMTYYVTEFDRKSGDMFGYVRNESDLEMSEWGYTNFNELKGAVASSKGLVYLDRDRNFKPQTVKQLKEKGVFN